MTLPTVFICDFIHDSLEPERAVLDGVADVVALDATSEADLVGRIEGAAAITCVNNFIPRDAAEPDGPRAGVEPRKEADSCPAPRSKIRRGQPSIGRPLLSAAPLLARLCCGSFSS